MNYIKKIIIIFTSSILFFFTVSFLTQYENISQSFVSFSTLLGTNKDKLPPVKKDKALQIIRLFNENIAKAYFLQNASLLKAVPMTNELRLNYEKDFYFLKQKKKIMQIEILDIKVKDTTRLSEILANIKTHELVKIRYLNAADKTELSQYKIMEYEINYTLELTEKRWKITAINVSSLNKT
ncbi:MAG: hypothetical protein OEZ22_10270 [Spirochaetia bacterium]|nr:hypothetical protein [Spirochaetia bacterium]